MLHNGCEACETGSLTHHQWVPISTGNWLPHQLKDWQLLNPSTPNDQYSGRTAPLTSKRCILYIYSTNIGTEYFKHGIGPILSVFSSSKCSLFHNSNVFGSCIIHISYTECAKIKKKNNSGAKRLVRTMFNRVNNVPLHTVKVFTFLFPYFPERSLQNSFFLCCSICASMSS